MLQSKGGSVRRGCEHFPREINSLDDLSESVRAVVLQNETRIRQIIYIPSQEYPVQRAKLQLDLPFRWRRTPHRTLIFGEEKILVVDSLADDSLQTHVIPLADLLSIRLVSALLYMYLELTWTCQDKRETIKIEFNAVGERMMKRELNRARAVIAARYTVPFGPFEEASISHFPFKFQTYTYGDLLPEETIWVGEYEPKIRTSTHYLRSFLSPNRVVVLTDQHLLVLEDRNRRLLEADLSEYWMERCFIPRVHVRNVSFDPQPDVTWMNVFLGEISSEPAIHVPLLEPRAAALQKAFAEWLAPARMLAR